MDTTCTPSQIIERIFESQGALSEQGAREFLGLTFSGADRERMNLLAQKARDGELTDNEKLETDTYELVGHFLSILKSKARLTLAQTK